MIHAFFGDSFRETKYSRFYNGGSEPVYAHVYNFEHFRLSARVGVHLYRTHVSNSCSA